MEKSAKIKIILKICLALIICGVLTYGVYNIGIDNILVSIENMPAFLKVISMVVLIIIQMLFAFLPGEPLELASGYLFGNLFGTIICLIGSCIGTIMIYFIVQKFRYKIIDVMFDKNEVKKVENMLSTKKNLFFVFIIFLIPGTPKDIITYVASLAKLKLSKWVILTTVGRIPSIITSTYLSAYLKQENYMGALIMLCVTCVLVVVGTIYYRHSTATK